MNYHIIEFSLNVVSNVLCIGFPILRAKSNNYVVSSCGIFILVYGVWFVWSHSTGGIPREPYFMYRDILGHSRTQNCLLKCFQANYVFWHGVVWVRNHFFYDNIFGNNILVILHDRFALNPYDVFDYPIIQARSRSWTTYETSFFCYTGMCWLVFFVAMKTFNFSTSLNIPISSGEGSPLYDFNFHHFSFLMCVLWLYRKCFRLCHTYTYTYVLLR